MLQAVVDQLRPVYMSSLSGPVFPRGHENDYHYNMDLVAQLVNHHGLRGGFCDASTFSCLPFYLKDLPVRAGTAVPLDSSLARLDWLVCICASPFCTCASLAYLCFSGV